MHGEVLVRPRVSAMKERRAKKVTTAVHAGEGTLQNEARRVSFVMTLWLEPREVEAEPEWRWRVCHVQTGEEAYFRRLTDMVRFVEARSGSSGPR